MSEVKDLNMTFSGCGFLGIYHLGVVSCLKENAPELLKRIKCYGGASAGSFASLALVLDLDLSESAEYVLRLAKRANSLALGTLHPSLHLVKTLRRSFEKILPENAHEIASGRLHISLTRMADMKNVIVSKYWSKDDLIEALLATSHVPFYSGILPAKFRGRWFIDGGLTDNLPQHFKEGETITVSPFSGESDICPKDGSNNFAHFDMRNTSVQFNIHNVYRMSRAFFPPSTDILCDMCKQGYRDTMRFLYTTYPDMIKTAASRKTSSSACHLPPWAVYNLPPGKFKRKPKSYSSATSAYSSCSSDEVETFGDVTDNIQSEVDLGESKLTYMLQKTCEAVTEAELWSCYIIKKLCRLLMLAAKPAVISLNHVTHMGQRLLELLPYIEKTGNQYFDQIVEIIITVIHTYQDKHVVNCRKPVIKCSETSDDSMLYTGKKGYPRLRCEIIVEDCGSIVSSLNAITHARDVGISSSSPSQDEDSDIEIIRHQSPTNNKAREFCQDMVESSVMLDSWLETTLSSDESCGGNVHNKNIFTWQSEDVSCETQQAIVSMPSEDFVLVDGYETDVESISSCDSAEE